MMLASGDRDTLSVHCVWRPGRFIFALIISGSVLVGVTVVTVASARARVRVDRGCRGPHANDSVAQKTRLTAAESVLTCLGFSSESHHLQSQLQVEPPAVTLTRALRLAESGTRKTGRTR
jgi:hypothetical protein